MAHELGVLHLSLNTASDNYRRRHGIYYLNEPLTDGNTAVDHVAFDFKSCGSRRTPFDYTGRRKTLSVAEGFPTHDVPVTETAAAAAGRAT